MKRKISELQYPSLQSALNDISSCKEVGLIVLSYWPKALCCFKSNKDFELYSQKHTIDDKFIKYFQRNHMVDDMIDRINVKRFKKRLLKYPTPKVITHIFPFLAFSEKWNLFASFQKEQDTWHLISTMVDLIFPKGFKFNFHNNSGIWIVSNSYEHIELPFTSYDCFLFFVQSRNIKPNTKMFAYSLKNNIPAMLSWCQPKQTLFDCIKGNVIP